MGNKGRWSSATMSRSSTPAFYALGARGRWKDYINLLHVPYTLWHLSYVVMGAALAPTIHWDRLAGTLIAFSLGVGLCSHTLDELNGRPLATRIPSPLLWSLAVAALAGAVAIGIAAGFTITPSIFPFVAFGAFIAVAYNLGLWGGRFHSDFWFALAWGAFPAFTSYWINDSSLTIPAILIACGCFALSLAQRALSTHARTLRRRVIMVEGYMEMSDGERRPLNKETMLSPAERTLQILSVAVVVLALALLTYRL